jgi:F0F1-type ATP synthase assembly protein I
MNRPPREESGETPGRQRAKSIGPFLTLGLQLALSVVVFFFVGRWLDGLWGTAPWLMLAGLLIGITGGFLQFFRSVAALGRQEEREKQERPEGKAHR